MTLLIQIGLYGPAVLADFVLFSGKRRNLVLSIILGVLGTLISVAIANPVPGGRGQEWFAYVWAIMCTGVLRALVRGIQGLISKRSSEKIG